LLQANTSTLLVEAHSKANISVTGNPGEGGVPTV